MEGASSLIVYLPTEEKDAQETKKKVEEHGCKCHLFPTDLRKKENCKAIVNKAVQCLGGIDILVNNAAFQNMVPDISNLSEYVFGFFEGLHYNKCANTQIGNNGRKPLIQTYTPSSTSQNTRYRT
jgi:NAD(P)-dependent dehydrogenase (short-subunit alcohol dehydrogenase family)